MLYQSSIIVKAIANSRRRTSRGISTYQHIHKPPRYGSLPPTAPAAELSRPHTSGKQNAPSSEDKQLSDLNKTGYWCLEVILVMKMDYEWTESAGAGCSSSHHHIPIQVAADPPRGSRPLDRLGNVP
ncbi:hypothetical protein Tco_0024847 [Tanacetum coccineum]